MALSVERFLEVADKKKRLVKLKNKIKLRIISAYMASVWLFAFLFSLPIVMSIELVQLVDNSFMCETNWSEFKMNTFFTIKFILPFTIIFMSSVKLLIFLIKHKNSAASKSVACQKITVLQTEKIISTRVRNSLDMKSNNSNNNMTLSVKNRFNVSKSFDNLGPLLRRSSDVFEINNHKNKKITDSKKNYRINLKSQSKAIKTKAIKIVLSIVSLFIIQW